MKICDMHETRNSILGTHVMPCFTYMIHTGTNSIKISYHTYRVPTLTHLGPQSRFRDKLLGIGEVCPQNGTAVLKGSTKPAFMRLRVRVERGACNEIEGWSKGGRGGGIIDVRP